MRFSSVAWQDGKFEGTASILLFDSKVARDAYQKHSSIRVEQIDYKRKNQLLREGRLQRLVLWDAAKPSEFNIVQ